MTETAPLLALDQVESYYGESHILKSVSLGPLHGYGILLRFKTDSSTKSIFLQLIYARLPPSAFCRRELRKRACCARLSGS